MTIKYGDLTIIYHPNQKTWMEWIKDDKNEQKKTSIILFEDNEICEVKDNYTDFKFNFLRSNNKLPRYFEKPKKDECIYFNKDNPTFDMFHTYSKNDVCIESKYNGIYYTYKNGQSDVFGIKRIKSTETMPRYQFAYDINEFTKEEIIYLIYSIIC